MIPAGDPQTNLQLIAKARNISSGSAGEQNSTFAANCIPEETEWKQIPPEITIKVSGK